MQRLRFNEVRTRGIHLVSTRAETRIHRLLACLSQPDGIDVHEKGAMDGEGHLVSMIGRGVAKQTLMVRRQAVPSFLPSLPRPSLFLLLGLNLGR